MKESLLLLSFSSLLVASSGILSQPTDKPDSATSNNLYDQIDAVTVTSGSENITPEQPLLLANITNIDDSQILKAESVKKHQ